MIEKILNWNKIANEWEMPKFNKNLELALLLEEVEEYKQAVQADDYTEILDAIIDIVFVWIGSLWKRWFTAEQIQDSLNRVINNNYSKFQYDEKGSHIVVKYPNWKIMKPEWFTPVDLSDIIPNNNNND